MLDSLDPGLRILACPLCGLPLGRIEHTLACENGHVFDIARQGYASFTTGGGPHFAGDTAAMVAARGAFLDAGHYAPIADAIARGSAREGWCVELAGGTGYYAARILDAAPDLTGVTIDVSKAAARVAARAHPRLASITADVRAVLPIASGAVDLILSVFGPRHGSEVARILAPGGSVVVVTPRARHLVELRERFSLLSIGADKEDRLDAALSPLVLVDREELDYVETLAPEDVVNSILMGPNAFHSDAAAIQAIATSLPGRLPTTVAVTISRYRAE
jgi:23S rRNA (guanine745-N1)-methyltransferase